MKTLLGFVLLAITVFICTISLVVIGQELHPAIAIVLFAALTYSGIRFGIGRLTRL
jgi:thiol:disulfide interchange protein